MPLDVEFETLGADGSSDVILFEGFLKKVYRAAAATSQRRVQRESRRRSSGQRQLSVEFDESLLVEVAKQLANHSFHRHFYLGLMLSFLVLVNTSTAIFRVFQCQSFPLPGGGEQKWLRSDYSISCLDQRWEDARTFAVVMIVVYPVGIPTMFAVLLWTKRGILGSEGEMAKEKGHAAVVALL